jgi:hypothetical protein
MERKKPDLESIVAGETDAVQCIDHWEAAVTEAEEIGADEYPNHGYAYLLLTAAELDIRYGREPQPPDEVAAAPRYPVELAKPVFPTSPTVANTAVFTKAEKDYKKE